jgi:hypothetical protein
MMPAVLLPEGRQQFFTTPGVPAVGYKLATFAAGTSTPQTTWADALKVSANPNPIILDARGEAVIFWEGAYKVQLQDASGAPIWTVDGVNSPFSASLIPSADNAYTLGSPTFSWANVYVGPNHAPVLDTSSGNLGYIARTAVEIAAGVTPVNFSYPFGDLRRYGGDATGGADSSAALQSALNCGYVIIPANSSFRILTPATKTGQVTILGFGQSSKLLSDGVVATITSGTGSVIDNFWMENLTAPYVITRNPASWGTVISTAVQSNTVLGYQPTGNDPELAALTATYPSIGSQNIGPNITFTGAASGITASRIYGRFVSINIMDATESTIADCIIRGGKQQWGGLSFDNYTNNIQRGAGNRAINNRVSWASNDGITFLANDDFTAENNHCYRCGVSGVVTGQTGGSLFTANVAGLTAGTLQAAIANGAYTFVFSDQESRSVTITGGTAAAWAGALGAGNIQSASYYGGPGQLAANPQCFRGEIVGNHCYDNYYDGLDANATVTGIDAAATYHNVVGNRCYRNGGDGMNGDGRYNEYVGNHLSLNYRFGLWANTTYSKISANHFLDNNQNRSTNWSELLVGFVQNQITDNHIVSGVGQNGYAIYAPNLNYSKGNYAIGSNFNFGATPTSYLEGNIDPTTGLQVEQSFIFGLTNNAGTLQHTIFGQSGVAALGNFSSRINNASASATNTPTGTDASTPFAAGAKIGSGNTSNLWFDTNDQILVSNALLMTSIAYNDTGVTALTVRPQLVSVNINGVTRIRLTLQFFNGATPFALNTTNITSGKTISVQFYGKLA